MHVVPIFTSDLSQQIPYTQKIFICIFATWDSLFLK